MMRLKKVLFFIVISVFVVTKVYAANAVANNWKIWCEDLSVKQGESTKCYVMTQISNATGTGKNIRYIATELSGDSINIGAPFGSAPQFGATGLKNVDKNLSAYTTLGGEQYSSSNPFTHRTGNTTCAGGLGCYDFYKQDGTILEDKTSNAVSKLFENNGYTALGYWTVYIDETHITADSDECAYLCLRVDYALEGQTGTANGLTPHYTHGSVDNSCFEIHLTRNPKCEFYNNKYYNKKGEEVTEAQYKEDCLPTCAFYNGKYYDNNRNEVTEAQYKQACFPVCGKQDGKYYDNNRNEVTEAQYRKACFSCKTENGVYYDKDGNETTKAKYQESCFPACKCENNKCYNTKHEEVTEAQYKKDCFSCKVIDNKYYDDNGNQVTEEEYLKKCNPKCKFENGKYYNSKGKEVTEEEYNKDCNPKCRCEKNQCYNHDGKPITNEDYIKICNPKCEVVDNKYYDNKGKEVTKAEYIKACACRVENNKYYNDKGEEVTQAEYYKACNPKCRCEKNQCYNHDGKPVTDKEYKKMCGCRKENGKFYDADGKEVTEEEWNAKCIPPTGAFIKYIVVIGFAAVLVGLYYYIRIYKAKKKIYKV